jgi:pantoate--beta-alanine ligase
MRDELRAGATNFSALAATARAELERSGFRPDYIEVRRATDLANPSEQDDEPRVVLGAAWLGRARLIDNLIV